MTVFPSFDTFYIQFLFYDIINQIVAVVSYESSISPMGACTSKSSFGMIAGTPFIMKCQLKPFSIRDSCGRSSAITDLGSCMYILIGSFYIWVYVFNKFLAFSVTNQFCLENRSSFTTNCFLITKNEPSVITSYY